jgi:predicted amidohydrolase YtcJ
MKLGLRRTAACALVLGAAIVTGASAASEQDRHRSNRAADTVLKNGAIYTVDKRWKVKDALAVRDGKIAFVGSNKRAKSYIGPNTKVIDLKGRMVMPGLEDHHVHPSGGGNVLLSCTLNYQALTLAQFQEKITACLDASRDKEPDGGLTVNAWAVQSMLPAGFVPTKADLDVLNTSRPIRVRGSDGHASLVNSRALQIAGITRDTPDPVGGKILRDANGDPTGMLADAAQGLVAPAFRAPPPTPAEQEMALQTAFDALNAQGVTSVFTAGGGESLLATAKRLKDSGKLTMRTHVAYGTNAANPDPVATLAQAQDVKSRLADTQAVAKPGVFMNTIKIFGDGINQYPAQTGALLSPYLENIGTDADPIWVPSENFGELYWPAKKLYPMVQTFDKAGWQVHIHCVGDRCVRGALEAVEFARKRNGVRDTRPTIAHIDLSDPADWPRFKKLGVIASMSMQWAQRDPFFLDASRPYFGDERWLRQFAAGSLLRNGAKLAAGSDWPVDPLREWFAMELAVTRTGELPGKYSEPLNASEGIPLKEAVKMNTINSAYQQFQDKVTGSLEVGKFADLIVLDQNIFKVPITKVSDTQVQLTMVGGDIVFDINTPAGQAAVASTKVPASGVGGHNHHLAHEDEDEGGHE